MPIIGIQSWILFGKYFGKLTVKYHMHFSYHVRLNEFPWNVSSWNIPWFMNMLAEINKYPRGTVGEVVFFLCMYSHFLWPSAQPLPFTWPVHFFSNIRYCIRPNCSLTLSLFLSFGSITFWQCHWSSSVETVIPCLTQMHQHMIDSLMGHLKTK